MNMKTQPTQIKETQEREKQELTKLEILFQKKLEEIIKEEEEDICYTLKDMEIKMQQET